MTRIETVVIVQKGSKILLGFKRNKKKFGGRWNGFGGGLEEEDEGDLEKCGVRETYQETGIIPKNLTRLGKVLFKFMTDEQDHEVHFLKANDYQGELQISNDFLEYNWFDKNELENIYNKMMPADKDWLPFFVEGEIFGGEICLGKKNGEFYVEYSQINKVESLN